MKRWIKNTVVLFMVTCCITILSCGSSETSITQETATNTSDEPTTYTTQEPTTHKTQEPSTYASSGGWQESRPQSKDILDTKVDYDIWSAVWDELISEVTSIDKAVDITTTVLQWGYDARTGTVATATLEAIASQVPLYSFISNLINQQEYYEISMILSHTPFPFRSD